MGFAREGVWVMGYCRLMGYGMHFPAHQVGGQAELWDIRGYGLSEVWVMTGSTVSSSVISLSPNGYECERWKVSLSHLESFE